MSGYAKGRSFEYRVKRSLEKRGYFVVRVAASKPVDLVAIKDGSATLVECKINRNPTSDKLELLHMYEKKSGCKVLIAVRKGRRLVLRGLREP